MLRLIWESIYPSFWFLLSSFNKSFYLSFTLTLYCLNSCSCSYSFIAIVLTFHPLISAVDTYSVNHYRCQLLLTTFYIVLQLCEWGWTVLNCSFPMESLRLNPKYTYMFTCSGPVWIGQLKVVRHGYP